MDQNTIEKTKLGISVSLFGAVLYFLGLFSILPVILFAGYALLCEQNAWLRKTAVKAVGIVIFFTVLSAILGLVSDAQNVLQNIIAIFSLSINLNVLHQIMSICQTVLSFMQSLLLIMLGFRALIRVDINFGFVDNVISKHM